ncbi:MAG: amidohydrolase [Anaerolineales bacterium]|nr:amidohydrolase [Anaerolineales bacterium]
MANLLFTSQSIKDQLSAWRRDFHAYPELGFQEKRTAARIVDVLKPLGYRLRTGVGRAGVIAELGSGSPVIGIRADMDALPIQERNEVPYASQVLGVMHACGHDTHVAMALGAATLLSKEQFPGTVRFLFQPAEEVEDEEGISGAPRMIEDGAMEGVDAVIALHVDADTPTGEIQLEAGMGSAGVDTFYATIVGKGGHGALPYKTIDPIYLASHVIVALNAIVSRRVRPFDQGVISIGSIHGGQADNVIPEKVDLTGTIRYTEPSVQELIHTEIERACKLTQVLGGDYQLKIVKGYPPMMNDEDIVNLIGEVAGELIGEGNVKPADKEMGAEDFAFFTNMVPGAMFSLGCRIEGDERQHHSPSFDIDERCLPIGTAILAASALRYLSKSN